MLLEGVLFRLIFYPVHNPFLGVEYTVNMSKYLIQWILQMKCPNTSKHCKYRLKLAGTFMEYGPCLGAPLLGSKWDEQDDLLE